MIIVAGRLHVDPERRADHLEDAVAVVIAARTALGCFDFHLSADPLDPTRINVFEQWESVQAVETFRGAGPSTEQRSVIRNAQVHQYLIASSTLL
jgi:quinol monooxygenase YgiN